MDMLDPVTLSRLQFAATALYHFLFVPLTLGLCWLLVVFETTYVMTGKEVWKTASKFWGKLFAINFAMGVATGITMEFQFGTNWAYYSHYVGDIFGAPLAIEGLMAFFLESAMVGLVLFGWNKMSKLQHLSATFFMALGTNLSAVWILIANGWMQNPVAAEFNPESVRMEMTSFAQLVFNPVAQAKFVHTVSAGYVTGSLFVLGIASYFIIKGKHLDVMRRSFAVAAAFGLAGSLSAVVLGDESGYNLNEHQQMKMAVIESMWETEKAPAGFNLIAIPNQAAQKNDFELKIPAVLGLIGTRSFDKQMPGIKQIVADSEVKFQNGIKAYAAFETLQTDKTNTTALETMKLYSKDLGYGLLLKANGVEPASATPEQIKAVSLKLVPNVAPLFWSFRAMVGLGFWFIILFASAFIMAAKRKYSPNWVHKAALYSIPLPWLAAELGWFVAEYGRQPWAVEGVLPTGLASSAISSPLVLTSLAGFVLFYSTLLVVDLKLLFKYARLGPPALGPHETVKN